MKNQQSKKPTHSTIQEQLVKHSICQRRRFHIKTIVYLLACLGSVSTLLAVVPAPDGGYPGGNTAEGANSLFNLAVGVGTGNTAVGFHALFNDVIGNNNTATGNRALANTLGDSNTADGFHALINNTLGIQNTGIGNFALMSNINGNYNTAVGTFALANNTVGSSNIALGDGAGVNLDVGNNNIDIGNPGVAGEFTTIRIGQCGLQTRNFQAGIVGVVLPAAVPVLIDPVTCQLGTGVSSARFKEKIQPMDKASEAIFALKPVTFRYKHELDPKNVPQFGLVAEEVEKINPNLVVRDEEGKAYTVRYEAVNAMLLNEFLKEHRTVLEQGDSIAQLKATVAQQQKDFQSALAQQQKQIAALTSTVQRVSNKLEWNQPTLHVVANDR
jgi:hypothetical protein